MPPKHPYVFIFSLHNRLQDILAAYLSLAPGILNDRMSENDRKKLLYLELINKIQEHARMSTAQKNFLENLRENISIN